MLCEKAEEKWRRFQSNLYDDELSYELLYEDGQKALCYLVPLNYFQDIRYQEVGKDFNKITLFLCSSEDYHRAVDKTECTGGNDSDSEEVVTKKVKFVLHSPPAKENSIIENDQGSGEFDSVMGDKYDNHPNVDMSVMLQIEQDEQLAKELQYQVTGLLKLCGSPKLSK